MNDDTNVATVSIERRAKKHVRSRTHTWLAVCAPGLEQILCAEMTGCGIVPSATEIHGGVEFDGRLETGMTANLLLRTPSRVLVRVASFKGRAVEDIFRETAAIPWEAWIPCDCAVDLQPTIHSSRIESPTLLKTTVQDAMIRRFNNEALAPPRFIDVAGAQKVLARLDEDRLTLSLDSSGDLLHRRGWRRKSVAAPIRESLAAAILLAAGYDGAENLVDAMCGSGTFAIEAALIAASVPPAISAVEPRRFAFMDWPAFPAAAWNHMTGAFSGRSDADPAGNRALIFARDIDPIAIEATRANAASSTVRGHVAFEVADFFAAPPPCPPGLLVLNPPYGLRLDVDSSPAALYRRIARSMQADWRDWRYAIVMPDAALARQWPIPVEHRMDFRHGGLDAIALIGKIP